jgi:hypothetical protein
MPPKEPFHFSHNAEELIGDLRKLPFTEPRRMKKRPTKELAPLLQALLVKYHIGTNSPEHSLREQWPEIVGPAIAAYSHPVNIDPQGRLLILTAHSVARSELSTIRAGVLDKIRALPGCSHIKSLLLRAG